MESASKLLMLCKNNLADNHKGCPYIVGTGFIPVRRPCRIPVESIICVLISPFIRIKIRRRVDTMWGGQPTYHRLE